MFHLYRVGFSFKTIEAMPLPCRGSWIQIYIILCNNSVLCDALMLPLLVQH